MTVKRSLLIASLFLLLSGVCGADGQRTHSIVWGDTLAKIAYKYYGDGKLYPGIAEANGIKDAGRIICGTILNIPELPSSSAQLPAAQEKPVQAALQEPAPEPVREQLTQQPQQVKPASNFIYRKMPNNAWSPGEQLDFDVKWQFITVGFATMQIRPPEVANGRMAYHIYTEARSAPFFDSFYKVRNTNESWIDIESLCSVKFVTSINEGKAFKTETLMFNQEYSTFWIVETGKTGKTLEYVQDILSALYYIRTFDLVVGQTYTLDAHSGDLSWPLAVKVVKREKVRVPAGEFDCFVVEPAVREGAGIFESKGRLWVWVTADQRKVPVKMSSKIAIGSVECLLSGIKLP